MKKLIFFVLIFLSLAFISCGDSNPVLIIEGGKVNGIQTVTKGIIAYKGIPFAAPPVGNLRWKEPHIAIRITKQ
jgi:para-nitrobenzyl esterase